MVDYIFRLQRRFRTRYTLRKLLTGAEQDSWRIMPHERKTPEEIFTASRRRKFYSFYKVRRNNKITFGWARATGSILRGNARPFRSFPGHAAKMFRNNIMIAVCWIFKKRLSCTDRDVSSNYKHLLSGAIVARCPTRPTGGVSRSCAFRFVCRQTDVASNALDDRSGTHVTSFFRAPVRISRTRPVMRSLIAFRNQWRTPNMCAVE